MKAFFIIALSSILVIGCSRNPKAEALLNSAEELTGQNPDSALRILDSIDVENLTRKQQMRYYLVHASAQNKAYIPFTSDSIMKEVVEYYDSHGTPNEQMLANYLMGRTYADMDNPMVALEYFHNAIERADTTSNDCDYKTLCRIYGQTADLFHMQLLPEYELRDEKLAVKYAWKAKDTLAALQFYEYLTGPYYRMGINDSVISISKTAHGLFLKYGYKERASATWPAAIYTYLTMGQTAEAKSLIDDLMQNAGWTDKNGKFTEEHKGCYNFVGWYYESINKLDSAEYCYREVLKIPLEMPNHEIPLKGLMAIYAKRNNADSVAKYARMYCEYNDSSYMLLSTDKVRRMQAIYDYSHNQQIAAQKTVEAEYYKIWISGLIVFILLATYIIYKVYTKQRKKKNNMLRKSQEEYNKTLQQYKKAKKEYAQLQNNYKEYKEAKHNEVKKLQQTLSILSGTDDTRNISNEECITETAIVKTLRQYATLGKLPSNADWKEFYEIANKFIPDFIKAISMDEYGLTPREIEICLLIRLNFQTSEIRNLLDISSQHITNIRSSINRKLFNDKGAKDLNHNIKTM